MALSDNLQGPWFMEGDKHEPCAIYQQGEVLLVVNEHGSLATGYTTGETKFTIAHGEGWQSGLHADIADGGKTIIWRNGSTVWRR